MIARLLMNLPTCKNFLHAAKRLVYIFIVMTKGLLGKTNDEDKISLW